MTLTRAERDAFVEAARPEVGAAGISGDDARNYMIRQGGGG